MEHLNSKRVSINISRYFWVWGKGAKESFFGTKICLKIHCILIIVLNVFCKNDGKHHHTTQTQGQVS